MHCTQKIVNVRLPFFDIVSKCRFTLECFNGNECVRFYALFLLLVFRSPYQHSLITNIRSLVMLPFTATVDETRLWIRTIELTCQMISKCWMMYFCAPVFFLNISLSQSQLFVEKQKLFPWQGCCPFTGNAFKFPEMNVFRTPSEQSKTEIQCLPEIPHIFLSLSVTALKRWCKNMFLKHFYHLFFVCEVPSTKLW